MGFKALLVQFYYSALINSIFTYRSKWSLRCQNRNIRPTFRTSGQSTYLLKGGFLKIQQTITWPTIKYAPKIFKVLPTALSLLLGTLRDLNIKKRTLREVNQPQLLKMHLMTLKQSKQCRFNQHNLNPSPEITHTTFVSSSSQYFVL